MIVCVLHSPFISLTVYLTLGNHFYHSNKWWVRPKIYFRKGPNKVTRTDVPDAWRMMVLLRNKAVARGHHTFSARRGYSADNPPMGVTWAIWHSAV